MYLWHKLFFDGRLLLFGFFPLHRRKNFSDQQQKLFSNTQNLKLKFLNFDNKMTVFFFHF